MHLLRTLVLAVALASPAVDADAFWGSRAPTSGESGWRTDGTGRYPRATPPLTWSPTQNVVWKRPLKNWSNATPVLHKDRIFTLEEPSTVVCLDQKTGEELWRADANFDAVSGEDAARDRQRREELAVRQRDLQKKLNELSTAARERPGDAAVQEQTAAARAGLQSVLAEIQQIDQRQRATGLPPTHGTNGYSSPTPVAAGDRVWVFFGTGVAAAFDLKGKRLWARIAGRPTNGWGHSASPVLVDGKLVLHIDRTVYALDPENGKELWNASSASWWGTPFPVEVGGEWAVVTTGGDLIRCRDGKVVSTQIGEMPWTSPFAEKGVVYVVDARRRLGLEAPREARGHGEARATLADARSPRTATTPRPLLHEGLLYAMTQTSHMTRARGGDRGRRLPAQAQPRRDGLPELLPCRREGLREQRVGQDRRLRAGARVPRGRRQHPRGLPQHARLLRVAHLHPRAHSTSGASERGSEGPPFGVRREELTEHVDCAARSRPSPRPAPRWRSPGGCGSTPRATWRCGSPLTPPELAALSSPDPRQARRDGPARRAPRRGRGSRAGRGELAALPRRGPRQHEPRGGAARGALARGRPARALVRRPRRGARGRGGARRPRLPAGLRRARARATLLRCLSLADGREIWRRWYRTGAKRNHGVSRTVPAVTDRWVVTIGPRCHVLCVDAERGEFLWGIDLAREYGAAEPLWYAAQNPLIDGGTVVIAPGGRRAADRRRRRHREGRSGRRRTRGAGRCRTPRSCR